MIVNQMTLGPIQANCFILGCRQTKEAIVIDPGDEPEVILTTLAKNKLTLKYIVNTHGHFDHVGANKKLKDVTNASIMIHSLDNDLLKESVESAAVWGIKSDVIPVPDKFLESDDIIFFGKHKLRVIHTPGHTKGGISLYIEYLFQGMTRKAVFVGDTLFSGSIGRTDLPGGDIDILLSSIHNKLFKLENEVIVYPGHMQSTTIGIEKTTNPFCGITAKYNYRK